MSNATGNGSNDVGTYRFKHTTVKDRLQACYLAFVNAPDPEHNSLGYMVYGGHEPMHVRVFENFAVFCVGGTSSDVREVDDYLDLFAHDVHKDWSKMDFHGLQAAKYMRQLLRLTHHYTGDMDMIAAEMIIIDYYSASGYAVRFDGTQQDFKLDGKRSVIWVGSHTRSVRQSITRVIDRHLSDTTSRTEQFRIAEDKLKAEYSDIPIVSVNSVFQHPKE